MTNSNSTPIPAPASTHDDTRDKQPEKLFFFDVDDDGTILESDFREPKINSQVYDNISEAWLTKPEDIIDQVEQYSELVEHFRWLARGEQEDLIRRIELRDYHDDKEQQRMKHLIEELEDEDDGWKRWIETEGADDASRFKKMIVDWLAAPIEWREEMPDNATAQGSAKRFFENEDLATLNELGVTIVEGTWHLSTYYAAVLEKTVAEANEIAQKLGLWYRFRENRKGAA